MKKIIILSIIILFFSFIGFAQEDITFSFDHLITDCSGSPSYFEFDIMATSNSGGVSGTPTTIFNSCVVDIQYPMGEFFGNNISNGGVIVTQGSDCQSGSGNDYNILNTTNIYDSVIEITFGNPSATSPNGTVLNANSPKAILHVKLKINNCETGSIVFTNPTATGLPSYFTEIITYPHDTTYEAPYTCDDYLGNPDSTCYSLQTDPIPGVYQSDAYSNTSYSADITSISCSPHIDYISPSPVHAGTNETTSDANDVLTISGHGFGSTTGSVQVPDANDGGTNSITLNGTDILSWLDDKIVIKMPSVIFGHTETPGSGTINILNACGFQESSPYLQILYSIKNTTDFSNTYKYRMNIVRDPSLLSGSYIFRCDTTISHNPQALACVKKAITAWNCYTGVNWILGSEINMAVSNDDGISNIYFSNSNFPTADAIMVTQVQKLTTCNTNTDAYTYEADINIRQNLSFGQTWSYDTTNNELSGNFAYFYDAILHELGHVHLLNHVNDPSDLMYYDQTNQRVGITSGAPTLHGAFNVINRSQAANTCSFITLLTNTISCVDPTYGVPVISNNIYKLNVFPDPASSGDITISYQLNKNAFVQLKITDCTGREVIVFNNEKKSVGTYIEKLNVDGLAKGIYLFMANIDGEYQAIKFIKL